jgi:hypothetical protein
VSLVTAISRRLSIACNRILSFSIARNITRKFNIVGNVTRRFNIFCNVARRFSVVGLVPSQSPPLDTISNQLIAIAIPAGHAVFMLKRNGSRSCVLYKIFKRKCIILSLYPKRDIEAKIRKSALRVECRKCAVRTGSCVVRSPPCSDFEV